MSGYDFSGANVLIIGDVMLDRYHFGTVSRISPEAPVPVVNVKKTNQTLGGAGNVANNISHLQAGAVIVGSCGKDNDANSLKKMLDDLNTKYSFIETENPTTKKLRVIGDKQQIVRVDFEEITPMKGKYAEKAKKIIMQEINKCSAVVISDYGKGFCTFEVCEEVIRVATNLGLPIIVDPKGSDWRKYAGATTITPNVKELAEAVGRPVNNVDEEVVLAAREVIERTRVDYMVVTRSEQGISIIWKNEHMHIPTEAREVFDVSGAGDTVVASLALSLGKGYEIAEAVKVANKAAGIVVSKVGTAPVLLSELNGSFNGHSKILERHQLETYIGRAREMRRKIVFTNGCFDILHKGHVSYMRQAASLGDLLILGLNSDNSVKRLKGEGRPLNNEMDRAEVLAALEFIDFIVIFDEDTPFELIKVIQPDILVKGGDYNIEDVVGREFAKKTVLIDFVDGYSTTKTIENMKGDSK
ncbi:MAG: bifunctional heptose 7-phosphate kinase/heptose 1-phosphate adenyltransferase [Denitrovibrio sp.]|nr:MAG: bifunctional heptose 7-phosphate kinase/heptose 1-phosphate adenyltransferase [Denitrovibrio sp.]